MLRRLAFVCLLGAVLLSGTILIAWWVPPLAAVLPEDWYLMVGATAATLLSYSVAVLILLFRPHWVAAVVLTGIGLAIAIVGLIGWFAGGDGGPALWLCGPSQTAAPSSVQTLSWQLLFGLGLLLSQLPSSWAGRVTNGLVAFVGLATLILISAHLYSAPRVFTTDDRALNSPQTALAMTLLLVAWYAQMLQHGRWAVATSPTANSPISVAVVDLAGLKAINDTMGHDAGSQAIVDMAQSLRAGLRGSDLVARVGGDEFVILGIGPEPGLRAGFKRITVGSTLPSGHKVPDYSVGFSEGPPSEFARLWAEADAHMYSARQETARHSATEYDI